jgi:hypothetical protein
LIRPLNPFAFSFRRDAELGVRTAAHVRLLKDEVQRVTGDERQVPNALADSVLPWSVPPTSTIGTADETTTSVATRELQ